ncbi:hypothetical protein [Labrys sp. ZIDIC5]|nr:hypothetical protein [Labrys sp. ZIDIC5]MDZ5454766.1 hypothetical protein [Labrys sp. ZIDIC5]
MLVNLTRGAARDKADQFDQPVVGNGVTALQAKFRLDEPMYIGML